MNIAILILAAGSSSRMGQAKQLLPILNNTLLGISIENALASNADQVHCVLGANAKDILASINHHGIEIIQNPNYQDGLSSSIAKGIQHVISKPFDAVLIMLGDQPKVDSKYLNLLIHTFKNNASQIVASDYSSNIGVPAIFPKIYFNHLLELKGDQGAGVFLNSLETNVISLKGCTLLDIDTQEDYLNFIKSL